MAASKVVKGTRRDVERALAQVENGLEALQALAISHECGVSGGTLSVCVEQMTAAMLRDFRTARDGARE